MDRVKKIPRHRQGIFLKEISSAMIGRRSVFFPDPLGNALQRQRNCKARDSPGGGQQQSPRQFPGADDREEADHRPAGNAGIQATHFHHSSRK